MNAFNNREKKYSDLLLGIHSTLNVQYDYSQMMVGKKSGDDYVTEGIAERNKKKAGSGDDFGKFFYKKVLFLG